jgi:two-component system chemotaxis response regulator CheB
VADIVVCGASLGGTRALQVVLAGLPRDFPLPVAVVLHRRRDSADRLAALLQGAGPLAVKEAEDKQSIVPGGVYLAPADYHLLVEKGNLALSTEAPVTYARPSIDVLFESAADAYGAGVIAVVLTGASADGAQGAARIRERGGTVVVQDPEKAEARVMPEAVLAAGPAHVLPLEEIAPFLVKRGMGHG